MDIATALKTITKKNAVDRTKCLGLVAGYLTQKQNQKGRMCLDSRSCKLLALFAPWCTEISLPFELGAEDALAFRIPPYHSGAPVRWYRLMNNLKGKGTTKSSMTINSGDWLTEFPRELSDLCYQVALYDPESRNEQDQWDQKDLWIKMHEATEGCNHTAFREGLKHHAFIHHNGLTHKCMTFFAKCLQ